MSFAVLTFGMAIICTVLTYSQRFTNGEKQNGIIVTSGTPAVPGRPPLKEVFGYALYFSVATETTLDYGDLAPRGYARYFGCVQSLCGLMLAGLFVGKLASMPRLSSRVAIGKCTGEWIEFSETGHGLLISLITIRYSRGIVHYDGRNFNRLGQIVYGVKGYIEPEKFMQYAKVSFWHSNFGDRTRFTDGLTTLWFQEESAETKLFDFFSGSAEDHAHGAIIMAGYRVTGDQEALLSSPNTPLDTLSGLILAKVEEYDADSRDQVVNMRGKTRSQKLDVRRANGALDSVTHSFGTPNDWPGNILVMSALLRILS